MNFLRPMTPATTGPELMPMRKASFWSPNVRARYRLPHVERELDEGGRVVQSLAWHPAGNHVAVADRLDLLDVIFLHKIVEAVGRRR